MARPLPLRTELDRERGSAFGYTCAACGRCCHGKVIPLNPYEVARLAQELSLSTTETITRFTDGGGTSIRTRADGGCVFLGPGGCTVHAGRPLACRLYPLGRHLASSGRERFAEVVPHAESEGVYGAAGTVADYLRAQGAGEYIAASDRYLELLRRMLVTLARREDAAAACDEARETVQARPDEVDASMLDVDAVVTRWCNEHHVEVPATVDERVALHIRALETMLAEMDGAAR